MLFMHWGWANVLSLSTVPAYIAAVRPYLYVSKTVIFVYNLIVCQHYFRIEKKLKCQLCSYIFTNIAVGSETVKYYCNDVWQNTISIKIALFANILRIIFIAAPIKLSQKFETYNVKHENIVNFASSSHLPKILIIIVNEFCSSLATLCWAFKGSNLVLWVTRWHYSSWHETC